MVGTGVCKSGRNWGKIAYFLVKLKNTRRHDKKCRSFLFLSIYNGSIESSRKSSQPTATLHIYFLSVFFFLTARPPLPFGAAVIRCRGVTTNLRSVMELINELKIEQVALEQINPYKNNAKKQESLLNCVVLLATKK